MIITWDNFYNTIQPYLPGCPEIVIDQHLQEAAQKFCERSEVWRYDLETDFTIAGLRDYQVEAPTGAKIENIGSMYLGGSLLKRVYDLDFKMLPVMPNARPVCYAIYMDRELRFYPTPDAKYEFTGNAVIKPALTALGVEDFIFDTHSRTIAAGAIASLAAIPGKEWTNQELAVMYSMGFKKHMDDAKGRDTRKANMRVDSVHFA